MTIKDQMNTGENSFLPNLATDKTHISDVTAEVTSTDLSDVDVIWTNNSTSMREDFFRYGNLQYIKRILNLSYNLIYFSTGTKHEFGKWWENIQKTIQCMYSLYTFLSLCWMNHFLI
jgi:hypothetical protein